MTSTTLRILAARLPGWRVWAQSEGVTGYWCAERDFAGARLSLKCRKAESLEAACLDFDRRTAP